MRSADLAMDLTAWLAIVPLCFASLLTGLVSSLATPLGLFRHYWVLVKLLITIPSTLVLLVLTTLSIYKPRGMTRYGSRPTTWRR
jgi:hypothetical protein